MHWLDWATLGIAVLGAGLGVLNTYHAVRDRRPKVRVTPAWAFGDGYSGLSIEVANLGALPITIVEIGFTLQRNGGDLPRRMCIPEQRLINGNQSPTRLERGEAKTIGFYADDLEEYPIRKAYARTATGELVRGSSPALKQFIDRGNKPL